MSSLVMVMSEFVVPSMVFSEVKKIKTKMIGMVYSYQTKLLERASAVGESAAASFDAAPYLFASTQLARKFPESLESRIIREFKTEVPKHSYQHNKKSSMNAYRSRLRLTAVMNSINLIFLFIIGHLMSLSASSLERCFYDIFGWVVIGYFMFFQAVLFQDNVMVAFFAYLSIILALGTFIYYYHQSASRTRSRKRAGVISIKSILVGQATEKEDTTPKAEDDNSSPAKRIMLNIVQTLGKQRSPSNYNARFSRIMEALKNTDAFHEGNASDAAARQRVGNLETNYELSSSDEKYSEEETEEVKSGENIEQNEKSVMINVQEEESHQVIFRRGKSSRNRQLMLDLGLKVDLADCSVGSYSDEELSDFSVLSDPQLSSHDDSSDSDVDSGSDKSWHDDIKNCSTDRDGKCNGSRYSAKLVRIIHSRRPDIHQIAQQRAIAAPCSHGGENSVDLSSNYCGESVSEELRAAEYPVNSITSNGSTGRVLNFSRVSNANDELFSKPKKLRTLSDTIRNNRDGIKRVGMKRRARGMGDEFVVSTEAHRVSHLAQQARAHTKLQKRIEQKKAGYYGGTVDDADSDNDQSRLSSRPDYSKSSSIDNFNEKIERVKAYASHESLRKHSLETQRQEAKALLQARIIGKERAKNEGVKANPEE